MGSILPARLGLPRPRQGVLVAEVMPGKLHGPQVATGEEPGHGLQGSPL